MFLTLCNRMVTKYLAKYKIQSLVYYGTPLHLHELQKTKYRKEISSSWLSNKVLAFPHHQYLSERQMICFDKINNFYS